VRAALCRHASSNPFRRSGTRSPLPALAEQAERLIELGADEIGALSAARLLPRSGLRSDVDRTRFG